MASYQHSYSVQDVQASCVQHCTWHVHKDKLCGNFSDADEQDEEGIAAIHPVYVIPYHAVSDMQRWFLTDRASFE